MTIASDISDNDDNDDAKDDAQAPKRTSRTDGSIVPPPPARCRRPSMFAIARLWWPIMESSNGMRLD